MNARILFLSIPGALCLALFLAMHLVAQDPPTPPPQSQSGQQAGPPEGGPGRGERRPGVFGKITAINGQSMQVATPRGDTVTVKLGSDTQFRKDREAAKLTDFKVGDTVAIRGEENSDHSWTAQMVSSRAGGFGGGGFGSGQGAAAREGGSGSGQVGQGMRSPGVLGQDYVAGEIKAIDAPKLTILRTDNVTQTIELDENTSLHKGRDSITMADIQPGDHVFVRGGMVNNGFQPRNLVIVSPQQWQRMQENGMIGAGGANGQAPKPPQSPDNSKPQNP
jgi:Domain of unknown function (DUF5666)